jgi:hypothetical protein
MIVLLRRILFFCIVLLVHFLLSSTTINDYKIPVLVTSTRLSSLPS